MMEDMYRVQEEIASRAITEDRLDALNLVGGADQAFLQLRTDEEEIISAVVVLEYPSMRLLYHSSVIMPVDFPYIPGLLSFREAPAIIAAFEKLDTKPDLLMIDGCGINHPRFAGLATHVGVTLDIPTIGVAKNLLCGTGSIPDKPGEASPITYHDREVAYYYKSKRGCRPLIVAPGHKVSPGTALSIVKCCMRKHKLPEPTRLAHLCANKLKRERGKDNGEIRRFST